ncbi:pentapeptide repeat-containing protein [Azospirillum doebereinerae]|uniref:Pentapeptide repeat-containing protein n=1 Tax=Azospirillum doebereinerae TaxID=92933 RepID=A0A3S0XB50_9PROT|nr:pentapeptide repeat-containing protein [Azospirillum doebereinerae]RUQ70727.1 pentapeptide repeat-containing protein [Azospirillum doebereinerae]
MAERDPNEVEEIRKIILSHQAWLKRPGSGKRADLSFRDLSRLNLERVALAGAKLAGANLTNTRMVKADLGQADLFGADMEGVNLTAATLAGADLRGANLHRALLTDANLRGADFRAGELLDDTRKTTRGTGTTRLTEAKMERSILAGANFAGCDLTGADLNDADLTGAELTSAVLMGTDFCGATLDGAVFGNTVMDQAALTRTYIPFALPPDAIVPPNYTAMPVAAFLELVAAHERWVDSGGAEGARLDLDLVSVAGADLAGRSLAAARLRRCRLPGARLTKASLEMAELSYIDLDEADLSEAVLRGATLRRAYLSHALLVRADARPAQLAGGRSWPTNFDGADFSDADLRHARMGEALVRGATFLNTLIDGSGIDLTNAALPSPPPPMEERRRQKRFVRPGLVVHTEHGAFPTRNWSVGGLCLLAVNQPYRPGQTFQARVVMADRQEIAAVANLTVLHRDEERGQLSVRFHQYGDDLKGLLKAAFLEHQKLTG